tara:strand:- start:324 stop:701 length:378 start_codon:yes stop_codon:yes gene_type:complete
MKASDAEGRELLCRCLAAVSMADGDLDGREIATIVTMVEQVTGSEITADDVVAATIEDWDEFQAELAALVEKATSEFRLQILKTSILVGRADDTMIDAEVERIYLLAEALGFSRPTVDEQFKVIR